MQDILFGVAFGQLLAVAVLIALELLLALLFWSVVEMCWQSMIRGLRSVFARFMPRVNGRVSRCS